MYIANYIFICILGVHITLLFCSFMGSKQMNNEFVCAVNYRVQTESLLQLYFRVSLCNYDT